jgi:hypothetical protein
MDRLKKFLAWAKTNEGRTDLGALLAAATAVYTAIHRAGIL